MTTIQTHEICAEGLTSHLVDVVSRVFGVEKGTVRAWRHPKESELNPTGTGKGNPLDQAARYITTVHQYNPGNARQAAQYFAELVDELDRAGGEVIAYAEPEGNIIDRVRECIREGADVQLALVGAELNEVSLRGARREIAEERAALERLDAAIVTQLSSQEKRA